MRESCLVYCYSGIQSLFEVVLLYTFYTVAAVAKENLLKTPAIVSLANLPSIQIL